MSIYRLEHAPELEAPVLVAALEGWVDAGASGTTAAAQLADGGTLVASFDTDAIYDYRARRPTLDILDASGATVRSYSSEQAAVPPVEGRNTPDYWLRPDQPLLKTAGLHRFVWDLHHERPAGRPRISHPR